MLMSSIELESYLHAKIDAPPNLHHIVSKISLGHGGNDIQM